MSDPLTVLLALPGEQHEAALVAAFAHPSSGFTVARRCVDLADLLAACAAGAADVALVGGPRLRLDRDSVVRARAAGVTVVALAADPADSARLTGLGVDAVLPVGADLQQVRDAVRLSVRPTVRDGGAGPSGYALPGPEPVENRRVGDGDGPVAAEPSLARGRLVAVWGPVGAPGRTTVAVNLADSFARGGCRPVLVDADTYGACVEQVLGLLDDDVPGIAAAARLAHHGGLDPVTMARHLRQVAPGLRVLTGLPRADRWPELRPAAMDRVWDVAREVADVVVVDCGFSIERDDELVHDTLAARRNAVTLGAVDAADLVVAVGSADPVGLRRLVRGLDDLRSHAPTQAVHVVVTRARRSVDGAVPARAVRAALGHAGIDLAVTVLPDDRDACDAALRSGRTLAEACARSPLTTAFGDLGDEVAERLSLPLRRPPEPASSRRPRRPRPAWPLRPR